MYLFCYFGLEEIDVREFNDIEKLALNMKGRLDFYNQKKRLSKKEQFLVKSFLKELSPYEYVYAKLKSIYYPKDLWVYEYNGIESLQDLYNDEYGVIYFIDEFLTLYNSLKSKDMTLEDFEAICQLRKQHKRIIACAQVFSRVSKGWREQVKEIVLCKNICGQVQVNSLIDGTQIVDDQSRTGYKVLQRYVFTHTVKLYRAYDTYQLVRKKVSLPARVATP